MRLKDKAKRRDSNWYRNIKMQIKNRELAEDFKEVFFCMKRMEVSLFFHTNGG